MTYSESNYIFELFVVCKKSEANQQQIVEAGGLTSLLMLLRNTEDETIHRVAAGAIANLAMNGNKMLFSLVSIHLVYHIIFFFLYFV